VDDRNVTNRVYENNPKVDIDALVVRYADPTYWYKAIQDKAESNIG